MQTYQKTTSVIFTFTLLFLLLSIFVKSYIVAIVGLVFGALVCWIPIVAFNLLFDDIARFLFSIPRESDVWWKWLLVFLFGLLIEGMLIASYIIYVKNLGKTEGFGWEDLTRDMVKDYSPSELPLKTIITIYDDYDNLSKKYSTNVNVKRGLGNFKLTVAPLITDIRNIYNAGVAYRADRDTIGPTDNFARQLRDNFPFVKPQIKNIINIVGYMVANGLQNTYGLKFTQTT